MGDADIIYKQNPIIRGYFREKDNKQITLLSEYDFDVLNAIYFVMQQNLFAIQTKEFTDRTRAQISISDIKHALGSNIKANTYIEDIKKSIDNIFNTEIMLKNFTNPFDNIKYKEYHTRIILSYGYLENEPNTLDILFDDLFIVNILRHTNRDISKLEGNFTPIKTLDTRSIKSKYGKRLYEYMLSVKNKNKEFTLGVDELNKLFGTNHTTLSEHNRILTRIKPKVCVKIEFEYTLYKRDKKIFFRIL